MPKLEVFYDLTCPFCNSGIATFMKLLKHYPQAEVVWLPVEAHPKDEEPEHKPYADQAVMAAFFARDHGVDLSAYNERVFDMHFNKRRNVDNPETLAEALAPLGIDKAALTAALEGGVYAKALAEANDYAYEVKKVWAVPTFVFGDIRRDAVGGVGVTEEEMVSLLQECYG